VLFLVVGINETRFDGRFQEGICLHTLQLELAGLEVAENLPQLRGERTNTAVPLLVFVNLQQVTLLSFHASAVQADGLRRPANVRKADGISMQENTRAPSSVLDHLFRFLVVEL